MTAGYRNEARAWREWLLRSVAGHPSELQIMYGIAGERRLTELELDWLPGYSGSSPVRIGNAAFQQLQIDVFGELMDTLFACNRFGLEANVDAWSLQTELLNFLEHIWSKPDHGLWESRGEPQHFTFSKIMAWVAFDRAVKSIDQYGFKGPRARWEKLRGRILKRSLPRVMIPSATASCSITAAPMSMRRYCGYLSSAFCRPKTRGLSERSRQSNASLSSTA